MQQNSLRRATHQQPERCNRKSGEREPESEGFAWLHAAHRHRPARCARHHRIDVGVVPHVSAPAAPAPTAIQSSAVKAGHRMDSAGRNRRARPVR